MRIREIMAEQGITSKELAERLDMSVSGLNQHIAGNPTIRKVEEFAAALDVPIWELFISPEELRAFASPAGDFVAVVKAGGESFAAFSLPELEAVVAHLRGVDAKGV